MQDDKVFPGTRGCLQTSGQDQGCADSQDHEMRVQYHWELYCSYGSNSSRFLLSEVLRTRSVGRLEFTTGEIYSYTWVILIYCIVQCKANYFLL